MSEQNVAPDRGITVGKSWPRPTTPAPLIPRWEGEFCSHADWVNFAHKRLTVARDSNGAQLKAMCVDTLGRRCANGRDMQRAHDEGTFPVRYFFDCEAADPVADDTTLYLIWSNEHRRWWAPNRQGYCQSIELAGRYSRSEAMEIVGSPWGWEKGCNPDEIAIPEPDALQQSMAQQVPA